MPLQNLMAFAIHGSLYAADLAIIDGRSILRSENPATRRLDEGAWLPRGKLPRDRQLSFTELPRRAGFRTLLLVLGKSIRTRNQRRAVSASIPAYESWEGNKFAHFVIIIPTVMEMFKKKSRPKSEENLIKDHPTTVFGLRFILTLLVLALCFLILKVALDKPFFLIYSKIRYERLPLGENTIVITPATVQRAVINRRGKVNAVPTNQASYKITQVDGKIADHSLSPADEIAAYALYVVVISSLTGFLLLITGFHSIKMSNRQASEQAESLRRQIVAMESHHADDFAPVINVLPGEIKITPGDKYESFNIYGSLSIELANIGRGASIDTRIEVQLSNFSSTINVGIINSEMSWIKTRDLLWTAPQFTDEDNVSAFKKLHDILIPTTTNIANLLPSRNIANLSEIDLKIIRSFKIIVTYGNILNAFSINDNTTDPATYKSVILYDFDKNLWGPVLLTYGSRQIQPNEQKEASAL